MIAPSGAERGDDGVAALSTRSCRPGRWCRVDAAHVHLVVVSTSWARSSRTLEASVTPCAPSSALPTPAGTVVQPLGEVTTWRVRDLPVDARPCRGEQALAKTATNVTSARPIISAAAVAAVRPGFRVAFSRASRPAAPPMRAAGGADEVRERPHEPRREHRDADEEPEHAGDDPDDPRRRRRRRGRARVDVRPPSEADHVSAATNVFRESRLRRRRPRGRPRSAGCGSPGSPARSSRAA